MCLAKFFFRAPFSGRHYLPCPRRRLSTMMQPISFMPVVPTRINVPEKADIILSDGEAQLCTLLDEFTQHLARDKGVHTSCRIAGGWVRDKVSKAFVYVWT